MYQEKIKTFRESKGFSQRELGEKVGLSGTMIFYIEQGMKKPSVDSLIRIAQALECTVNDLVEE